MKNWARPRPRVSGKRALMSVAAVAALAAGVSGCGAGGSVGTGNTVPVDVGDGMTVNLPEGELRIGVFMNGLTDQWTQNFSKTVQAEGEAIGAQVSVLDAGWDINTQLNQLQTAATNKNYDAAIVVAVDGRPVCNQLTKTLPQANVLVVDATLQICGRVFNEGDELYAPGTLTYVGGDSTVEYLTAWAKAGGQYNPGPQKVLAVVGPQVATSTQVSQKGLENYAKDHPEFDVQSYLYTDYTTQGGYNATLNYLKANKDISLIMSAYSPDLTRGVINALESLGLAGKIPVGDVGGSQYTIDQIKAGNVQFTLPYNPITTAKRSVQSIVDAQNGQEVDEVVSNLQPWIGPVSDPKYVTKENVDTFTPEY
ncbi:sugar ABC transporter substrate-binding protein [Gordonia sp. LSe1-13]|uniref:Sugar ABC transporter substrate-binding protein n=1 Tax=Gordonia sesuvii TaxID=3116777 RepID=A0ABU7MIQ5_9ACTN|nr:sugar ABC transporter substrate-binding protein [Gordonia sp. LSe1-13]